MILVVGRPGLDGAGGLSRTPGRVAVAAAQAGAPVELVGSIGDDAAGDAVVVALGRAGIGHAALLRDPATPTPTSDEPAPALPRLDASDMELGLRYLPECRVLVLAEPLPDDVRRAAMRAADYHGARLVAVREAGQPASDDLPPTATEIEIPADDSTFPERLGRYAARVHADGTEHEPWSEASR